MADPEYVNYTAEVEQKEEEEKHRLVTRVRSIIEDELNIEVKKREDQLETIEMQILRVRKLLYTLRYVIVASYYKKRDLEHIVEEDQTLSHTVFEKHNRLHPAIKKLLNSKEDDLDAILGSSRGVRQAKIKQQIYNGGLDDPKSLRSMKRKRKDSHPCDTLLLMSDYEWEHNSSNPETPKAATTPITTVTSEDSTVNLQENRRRRKHKIIVGNTSKWLAPSEDDQLLYKWMVYIRGPKEAPSIEGLIEKVVMYLHPSYKPFDVIQINTPPFRLIRKGWGEFPIRLKISFKSPLNKPIEIVHHLKLDLERIGREMLGQETVVELYLYGEESVPLLESFTPKNQSKNIDLPLKQDGFVESPLTISTIYSEHSYFKSDKMNAGLEYCKWKLEQLKASPLIPKSFCMALAGLPMKKTFKNMGEILPYLFRRMPLYQMEKTKSSDCLNPFLASSLSEFLAWNVGQQRSVEWQRAKLIEYLVIEQEIPNSLQWNAKAIFLYGRSHHYTPFLSDLLFSGESIEKNLLLTCFSVHPSVAEHCETKNKCVESLEVDVTSDCDKMADNDTTLNNLIDLWDPSLAQHCSFVRQTARNSGIILKSETIVNNEFRINGAERMIFESIKCLAEGLIRRAINHSICKNEKCENIIVTTTDIKTALEERIEFGSIVRFQHQRRLTNYYL